MYSLNGWSLVEVNATETNYVKGDIRIVVQVEYPTFMREGGRAIRSYIGDKLVETHTSVAEAMKVVDEIYTRLLGSVCIQDVEQQLPMHMQNCMKGKEPHLFQKSYESDF